MRFRLPIAAAILLAVAAGPVLAQGPSSEKPAAPTKFSGKTLEQWVREIKHGDPGRREAAIRIVPYFKEAAAREAVPALLSVLQNDTDASCRVHAALTLSILAQYVVKGGDTAEAVKVLINRAESDPQAIVRLHVVFALGSFGPEASAAVPVLIRHIHDPLSWELRQAALASLASVGRDVNRAGPDKDAIAAVAKLLTNNDEKSSQVRLAAVTALHVLGKGKPEEKELVLAKEALTKATGDADRTVAIWAWVALMTLDKVSESGLSVVVRYLTDKDAMVRVAAVMALGALGADGKARLDKIIDRLDDADPLVVAAAVDVLGGFGKAAEKAVPALRKVMERREHTEFFRQAAAVALKNITGVEEKLPAPTPGAGSGSSQRKPIDPTEVGGRTLDQWIKEIKSNPDPSVQELAMRVVPYFGQRAGTAAPALIDRLKEKDPAKRDIACRAHAVLALAAIADQVGEEESAKAVKAFTDILDNDSQAIMRYHAATALGAYGSRAASAVPSLLHRLPDRSSWEVRQAVLAALSNIVDSGSGAGGVKKAPPDGRVIVAIADRLNNNYENSGAVRMMAVMVLGALGRPAGREETSLEISALKNAGTYDPDKTVQIWAEVALMAIDKVTDKGLSDVARHLAKGKDVTARLTAARALMAMGKEAKSKVGDIAKMLDDDDPTIMAGALDVLAGFGAVANDAVPAIRKFADKLDKNTTMTKEQRDYFKEAAKYTIEQIEGAPKK
jgi:HEAT repeat protein